MRRKKQILKIVAMGMLFGGIFVLYSVNKAAAQTQEYLISDYGAKCDAQNDDAPAVRKAIAAASRGGIIRFPDNATCVLASEIKVTTNNIQFVGAGDGRQDAVGTGEGVGPLDYTTKANKSGQTRIIVNTSVASRLEDNHPLKKISHVGTAVDVQADNFKVSGIRFIGPRVWYKDGNDPAHDGKIFSASKRITINNSTFDGVGYALIRGGTDTTQTFTNNFCINWGRTCVGSNKGAVLEGNVFRQTGIDWAGVNPNKPAHDRYSEYASYVYATSSGEYNFTFTNNLVEGTRAGVHVNGGGQGVKLRTYKITNNTFRNNLYSIIGSDFGGGARWENVSIANNVFESDKLYSIYVYKGQDITIENNRFTRTNESDEGAIQSGIRLMPHQDDTDLRTVTIRNNTFDASGATNWSPVSVFEQGGYRLGQSFGKVSALTVDNNMFMNLGDTRYGGGLYFIQADKNRVADVTVNCNTFTADSKAGKTDQTAFIRFGGVQGSKPSFFVDRATIANNAFTSNGSTKLYGILSQNSSLITGGKIGNNSYAGFSDALKSQVKTTGVTTNQDAITTSCKPGVPATVKTGITFAANSTTSVPASTTSAPATPASTSTTTQSTTATSKAKIVVSKRISKLTANVGETVIYTIVVDNEGAGPASDVVVSDSLPSRLQFDSASDGGTMQNGVVTWKLGALEASQQKQVTLTVKVK